MKKNLLALVLVAPLTLGLSGCVISVGGDDWDGHNVDWEDREYKNRKTIADLELDTNVEQIRARLGVPDFNESFMSGDEKVNVLYYRTQHMHGDGKTTKDECTPLVFKAGQLIGWGDSALARI
jgi:hypothetical protein